MKSFTMPIILSISLLQTTCGEKAKSPPPSKGAGDIQAMFIRTATDAEIPVRLLLAVAFMESNLSHEKSSATYGDASQSLGLSLGETAFGLSYKTLGILENPDRDQLKVQLEAYAEFIKRRLYDKRLELQANPNEDLDKFNWIWNLAQFHRGGTETRQNIQVVFALELINMLNYGHTWQDTATGEVIELTPESPPIKLENLPNYAQKTLQLIVEYSDIHPTAKYFDVFVKKSNDNRNEPKSIKVIHCPFSLSACLEMQRKIEESDGVRMQAHYIIPEDESVVSTPLQVANHNQQVWITNIEGKPEPVVDAIVVMLTGISGRYVEGKRRHADPKWLTDRQLKNLGLVIKKLCPELKRQNSEDSKCYDTGENGGPVLFQNQGKSSEFQWGDIPEYDKDIFWPYLKRPDAFRGIGIEFSRQNRIYRADEEIVMTANFHKESVLITIEQAKRCKDDKLVWTVLQNKRISNRQSQDIRFTLLDKGPNENGIHFIRTTIYNKSGLEGWNIENVLLTDYEKNLEIPATDRDCQQDD